MVLFECNPKRRQKRNPEWRFVWKRKESFTLKFKPCHFIISWGRLPHKRHTIFRQPNGELYHEQLFGTVGFAGMSSLLYHVHPPTMVKEVTSSVDVSPRVAVAKNMKAINLKGFAVPPKDDYLESRGSSFWPIQIAPLFWLRRRSHWLSTSTRM